MFYYDSSDGRMFGCGTFFVCGANMGCSGILHCIIPANTMFYSMNTSFEATNEILLVSFVDLKTESCLDLL